MTTTMTTMRNAFDAAPPDADAVRVVRNMNSRVSVDDPRTSQSRSCTCVHCIFGRNLLASKRNLAGDLADHVFGHLVPTELARDILTTFVTDGVVQVFEGVFSHGEQVSDAPFEPHSEDVQRALGQAFKVAAAHDCTRLCSRDNAPKTGSSSTGKEEEKEEKTYSFRWRTFPREPFEGDELVSFLNDITDRAFAVAKAHPATTRLAARHRFVAPKDKRHVIPLMYESHRPNVGLPDFLLLPIEAFSGGDIETVDEKWVNLSAGRLVGESKEDLAAGLEELQWHAQDLKSTQPWVYYVLGMTISLDVAVFSRLDCSDWEHLVLMLWDGRGCIDFIRILLGLALADGVDLGQNPFIELRFEERTFQREHVPSDAVTSTSTADSDLYAASSDDGMSTTSDSSSCHRTPAAPFQKIPEKKDHSEIEGGNNE